MKPLDPNAAFRSAEKAIAKGDWLGARRAYGRVLKSLPRDWRGFYRAGLLEARGQNYQFAENALARALSLAPDNAEIAANLAQIHLLTGNASRALELLRPIAEKAPTVAAIHHRIGLACQELGRLEEAEQAYREAMDLGSRDPAVLNNRAVVLQALGRVLDAIVLLESLRKSGSAGIETLNNLGNLYRIVGRHGDSAEIFALALRQAPLNSHLHRNLALLNRDGGDVKTAIAAARRAAVSQPGSMDGMVIIGELLEHRAELSEAEQLVRRGAMAAPDNPDAAALLARIMRRTGRGEAALAFLRGSPAIEEGRAGGHKLLFEAAQSEQALGRHEQAFETLVAANRRQIAAMPAGRADPKRVFSQVRALGTMVDALNPADFAAQERSETGEAPVFLVGFPRSGTTLLDQVLDSHPSVVVLEERPLVTGMIARLRGAGFRYPEDLLQMKAADLTKFRQGYLEDRNRYVSVPKGSVFVDKMPLNIVHAALIQRVFPAAKFLLALRDPRDVCLSCFMQSFELNDWMAVFTDIEDTARLFDEVFELWGRTAEKLDLVYHAVRYEQLIADLRGTASAAIGFLGLEWDDAMAAYHEHARNRGHLATPSHSQVTQPVYSHAVQRWRRYGAAMEKTAEILKPSCIALGYGG